MRYRLPRRSRRPQDLLDAGASFDGFDRDAGVWCRPDHLDEPDGEPASTPLERLGTAGASAIAVALVAFLVAGLVAGFGRSVDKAAVAREEPVPGVAPQAAVIPVPPPMGGAPVAAEPRGEVVVLDQGRSPAAARALTARLKAAGWRVTGTGDWHGRVPATTVYHPAGQEAAARKLAADLPEVRRIKPTFPGISQSRLVVIVVDAQNPPLVSKVLGTAAPKG
jgi:hypothetical protein